MFRRFSVPLSMISALFFLTACAVSDPVDPNDPSRSLVYGYIDMEDAPSSVGWVYIRAYNDDGGGYRAAVEDGVFYHVGISPGPHQVDTFGRSATWYSNTNYTYEFGSDGRNETAVRIEQPGVYFMGAYKYISVSTGWLKPSTFEMKKVEQPNEHEILTAVLKRMEVDNAEYVRQISEGRRRLAQLASSQ